MEIRIIKARIRIWSWNHQKFQKELKSDYGYGSRAGIVTALFTMFRRKHEIDTKLLLHAIQRTGNFESLLSRRFAGVTLKQYEEKRKEAEERRVTGTGTGNPFEEEEAIDDPNNPFFEKKNIEGEVRLIATPGAQFN